MHLRSILNDVGYTPDALRRLLGVRSLDDVGLLNHAATVTRLRDDRSPAAALLRLFFLEEPEPLPRLRRALGRVPIEAMMRAGWLRARDGSPATVDARVRVDPIAALQVISDRRFRACDRRALRLPRGDEVYPPSSDSLLLGEVASAARRGRVLDLCTGSGIQALLQSGNADTVVAVDINPRAVAVARMNAALNELANIEVREGDLYAPVRGERFDLIVANPPFVTSPYDTAPSFHAGGPTGDRVLRRILRGLADHLAAGGRAFAVAHVGLRRGERLETVADRWFAGFRGQALVLSCETGSAIDLSAAQALFALRGGLAAYRREIDRWHTCLRRRRIETVSLILIAARLGGRHRVEVIDASPRILPLPLAPGPAERIAKWLAG